MSRSAGARSYCLSGLWVLESERGQARLRRPSDDAIVELEDASADALEALWASLQAPLSDEELGERLAAFGEGALELRELLLAESVVRDWQTPDPTGISGPGALPELTRALVSEHGYRPGPLSFFTQDDLRRDPAAGRLESGVALCAFGDHVVAVGPGCMFCSMLRALGAVGQRDEDQTAMASAPSALDPSELSACLAAVLTEIERAELLSWEGLWLRHGRGLERGLVLEHPDCPSCADMAPAYGAAWLRHDLDRSDGAAVTSERIRSIFGDSPFAPLAIDEAIGPVGRFPHDVPYVHGGTRLSRLGGGRIVCTSLPGLVHGSAASAERSRLLAWSEGVERLAAQGASADVLLAPTDPRAIEARQRFGLPPTADSDDPRAFCSGLDLLHRTECLVPFERVAVALPASISPHHVPVDTTFTGAASHVTSVEAIVHGTVELLKRDAFLVAWYRKRRLRSLHWPSTAPAELLGQVDYLRRHGLDCRIYDLRAELPLPMLLLEARARRRVGQWPAGGRLLVPAGGFTALDSLRHALTLASSRLAGLMDDDSQERNPLDPVAVERLGRTASFWPGVARYLNPANAPALDFLADAEAVDLAALDVEVPSSPVERFALLGSWLAAAELGWVAVPLATRPALAAGLRVIKAIVPEAVPMALRREEVDRKHPRFARALPGAVEGSWNDDPHPLY